MPYELTHDGKVVGADTLPVKAEFYEHMKQVGLHEYEPTDYITVRRVGVKDYISRKATDEDKARFPREWAAYKAGQSSGSGETPLTELPACKSAFVLELQQIGVNTIEELAAKSEVPYDYLVPMWKQAKRYIQLTEAGDAGEQQEESRAGEGQAGVDHFATRPEHGSNPPIDGRGQSGLPGAFPEAEDHEEDCRIVAFK